MNLDYCISLMRIGGGRWAIPFLAGGTSTRKAQDKLEHVIVKIQKTIKWAAAGSVLEHV